jgi:S1-C subfamily serine protease
MSKVHLGVLAGGLALVVGAAVSTVLAQDAGERPAVAPRPDRHVMVFDGRGGRIGVTVKDLTADEVSKAGGTSGVRIDGVEQEGAAARAGVHEGDIVVDFDGERVRSARQLSRLVQETADDRTVQMTVVRDGQRQTLDVTPERGAAMWSGLIDGDRVRREVERGMRGLDAMPSFRIDPGGFTFDGLPLSPVRLGVQLDTLTPQLADYFGAEDGGALVAGVTAGSAAEKAGVTAGDVIVSIGDQPVRTVADVRSRLRTAEAGALSIGVVRDRKDVRLTATIERAAASGRRPRRQL